MVFGGFENIIKAVKAKDDGDIHKGKLGETYALGMKNALALKQTLMMRSKTKLHRK